MQGLFVPIGEVETVDVENGVGDLQRLHWFGEFCHHARSPAPKYFLKQGA